MAEPDREKMMQRINNLNVTLESLYRQAWQDGFEAGQSGWEKHRCWNCTYFDGNDLCTKLWKHVDGTIHSLDHCAWWTPGNSTKEVGRSGADWMPFER